MQKCTSQYQLQVPSSSSSQSQSYISSQGESTSSIPLTYENLPKLAKQKETIRLTGEDAFFSITQPSKINEVTTEKYYLGWKLHLSVCQQDLQEAFGIVAPIISEYGFFFKVINLGNKNIPERYKEGTQITIPLEELENPVRSPDDVKTMMQEIERALSDNKIGHGKIPASDAPTFSPYFSLRNDKKPNVLGTRAIDYIDFTKVGKNFNPANNFNLFENLLGSKLGPFDPYHHFLLFDVDIQNPGLLLDPLLCLQSTLFSYVREYSIFDMMSDQDKDTFMRQYCVQDGKNLNAEFLKADYKDNSQILLAVQQAFSLIFRFEADTSWGNFRYYEYVNSAELSKQYPYDDSFKKLIVVIEAHAKIRPEMHQFLHGEEKRSLLDMYSEKTGAVSSMETM